MTDGQRPTAEAFFHYTFYPDGDDPDAHGGTSGHEAEDGWAKANPGGHYLAPEHGYLI
jgi:hypothetical protein